jgi:hypothetical protein
MINDPLPMDRGRTDYFLDKFVESPYWIAPNLACLPSIIPVRVEATRKLLDRMEKWGYRPINVELTLDGDIMTEYRQAGRSAVFLTDGTGWVLDLYGAALGSLHGHDAWGMPELAEAAAKFLADGTLVSGLI